MSLIVLPVAFFHVALPIRCRRPFYCHDVMHVPVYTTPRSNTTVNNIRATPGYVALTYSLSRAQSMLDTLMLWIINTGLLTRYALLHYSTFRTDRSHTALSHLHQL